MKHRFIALTFAACLLSSVAFADNPSDAPLVPQEGSEATVEQQNCASQTRQQPDKDKKDKAVSAKAKSKNPPNKRS